MSTCTHPFGISRMDEMLEIRMTCIKCGFVFPLGGNNTPPKALIRAVVLYNGEDERYECWSDTTDVPDYLAEDLPALFELIDSSKDEYQYDIIEVHPKQ